MSPDDEIRTADDALPDRTTFTPLERKAAEAFIILQRLQTRLGYWELRRIQKRQEDDAKDGS